MNENDLTNAWRELKKDMANHPWAVKFATWGAFFIALQALLACVNHILDIIIWLV